MMIRRILVCVSLLLLGTLASWADADEDSSSHSDINVTTVVPVISVETSGPADVNVQSTASYVITVKNIGDCTAGRLVVRTILPETLDLQFVDPKPAAHHDGELQFVLGDLEAKAERRITLQVKPQETGPVDLLTSASFSASSQTTVQVRRPQVTIACTAPTTVTYGDQVPFELTITNTGDGTAENVTVSPRIPPEALRDDDSAKPLPIGPVRPGQTKDYTYIADANVAKSLDATFEVRDDSGQRQEASAQVTVLRPMLNVALKGPAVRYIHRRADYEIQITNPGDAPAHDVEVVLAIPPGLDVLGVSKQAVYHKSRRTLTWKLPSVEPGAEESWAFAAKAIAEGSHVPQVVATSRAGIVADAELATQVVSRPNLHATVINTSGPMEVNQPVEFTLQITNDGIRTAENVAVAVELPEGVEGRTSSDAQSEDGRQLEFQPVTIAAGEQKTIRFVVVGRTSGDHVVRVTFQDQTMSRPLAVESTAFFYDDSKVRHVAEQPESPAAGPSLLK